MFKGTYFEEHLWTTASLGTWNSNTPFLDFKPFEAKYLPMGDN